MIRLKRRYKSDWQVLNGLTCNRVWPGMRLIYLKLVARLAAYWYDPLTRIILPNASTYIYLSFY